MNWITRAAMGVVGMLASAGIAADAARPSVANEALAREFATDGGRLATVRIANKLAGREVLPAAGPEFRLRISQGTDKVGTDVELTAADFAVAGASAAPGGMVFALTNARHGLSVDVQYTAAAGEPWSRKRLLIRTDRPVVLEQVDVEVLPLPDAWQPYTKDAITANAPGNWSPNLGQPLYGTNSATFWGVEFPAARNHVRDGLLVAGYPLGRELRPGQTYTSHAAVVGVSDDALAVSDAFQSYIDRTRIRPLRLQTQYNSWFDYGGGVTRESFARSVKKIHEELVVARGIRPLKCHVIDDGWQATGADWSGRVWTVNGKFDPDLASSRADCEAAGSRLGLWLSPGCLFGAHAQVAKLRAAGYEAMDDWMSMAGPRYMQKLEDRMAELVGQGVCFFKLDGVFGHLNLRNFELRGSRYGLAEMPQLGVEGLRAGSRELNDPKYDELKLYYLAAGTERLMQLFARLGALNPDLYIVISNGAYLSPWWLQWVDAVWMINAGDAAGGSTRTAELVYRDGIYHTIYAKERTQFPLSSLFNHEPKKTGTGESKDVFRRYLYMSLSRATGFEELYIKPFALAAQDWDVIAEGLLWAEAVFPAFRLARMHGGDPRAGEVYGYAGWTADQGYVSLHNPSAEPRDYAFTLDRGFGVPPGAGPFHVSSPFDGGVEGLPARAAAGDRLSLRLAPREIRILNFDRAPRDWSRIQALQVRTPEAPVVASPGAVLPPAGHALLGAWSYEHGGAPYTRTFGADGRCSLRRGDAEQWVRPFTVDGPSAAVVEGGLRHVLQPDGTLLIEGRYRARRK